MAARLSHIGYRRAILRGMFDGLFQPLHLLLIVLIVLIIFGPSKLPEIGKSLGDGLRGFKEGMKGDEKK